MAVHGRPAAFEGCDGLSYSVDLAADRVEGGPEAWGAYLLFLRWRRVGGHAVEGHLETAFLAWGTTAAAAREALGRLRLAEVRERLDALIRERASGPARRWWDVMREEE